MTDAQIETSRVLADYLVELGAPAGWPARLAAHLDEPDLNFDSWMSLAWSGWLPEVGQLPEAKHERLRDLMSAAGLGLVHFPAMPTGEERRRMRIEYAAWAFSTWPKGYAGVLRAAAADVWSRMERSIIDGDPPPPIQLPPMPEHHLWTRACDVRPVGVRLGLSSLVFEPETA